MRTTGSAPAGTIPRIAMLRAPACVPLRRHQFFIDTADNPVDENVYIACARP
ncbi:hypothetical protein I6G56_08195 [Burkholderia humptydooensis]|uniref:Uncharacterized protein n=1 Tax=Burkholderia humptydooensis TaxID=430531 RepID=A0A7T2U3U7_9BURK|nr:MULTISPECIES: hypothetical protein [Burkholderia]QPS45024.1 hypothetical protein I6G56_08195 [Burkholderia humptydooensis]